MYYVIHNLYSYNMTFIDMFLKDSIGSGSREARGAMAPYNFLRLSIKSSDVILL